MFTVYKRTFLASVIILVLCVAMLTGTTLAWFTSSVSNTGNKINSGTLDVDMLVSQLENGEYTEYVSADNITGPLFNISRCEPGYSNAVKIKIENKGNLAARYSFSIVITESLSGIDTALNDGNMDDELVSHLNSVDAYSLLENAIDVYQNGVYIGTLNDVADCPELINGSEGIVYSGDDCPASGSSVIDLGELIFKMSDEAGNEYQNSSIKFDVRLNATQYTYETDGFDSPYYDSKAFCDASGVVGTGDTVLENEICKVVIPEGSQNADAGDMLYLFIKKTGVPKLFTDRTMGYQSYSIKVFNQNNEEVSGQDIAVDIYLGESEHDQTVKHIYYGSDDEIESFLYKSDTGRVEFNTDMLGQYTFAIDADAVCDSYFYNELPSAIEHGGTVDVIRNINLTQSVEITGPLVLNGYDFEICFSGQLDVYNDVVFYISNNVDDTDIVFNGGNYICMDRCSDSYNHYLFAVVELCAEKVLFNDMTVETDVTAIGLLTEGELVVTDCEISVSDALYALEINPGTITMSDSVLYTENINKAIYIYNINTVNDIASNFDNCMIVSVFGPLQQTSTPSHANIEVVGYSGCNIRNCCLKGISDDDCYNILAEDGSVDIFDSTLVSDKVFASCGKSSIKLCSGVIQFTKVPEKTAFVKESRSKIEIPGTDSDYSIYSNVNLDGYVFKLLDSEESVKVLKDDYSMSYNSDVGLYEVVK